MPGWLHVIARVNPLTYEVQGLRQMLSASAAPARCGSTSSSWPASSRVMLAAATRAYPKAIL